MRKGLIKKSSPDLLLTEQADAPKAGFWGNCASCAALSLVLAGVFVVWISVSLDLEMRTMVYGLAAFALLVPVLRFRANAFHRHSTRVVTTFTRATMEIVQNQVDSEGASIREERRWKFVPGDYLRLERRLVGSYRSKLTLYDLCLFSSGAKKAVLLSHLDEDESNLIRSKAEALFSEDEWSDEDLVEEPILPESPVGEYRLRSGRFEAYLPLHPCRLGDNTGVAILFPPLGLAGAATWYYAGSSTGGAAALIFLSFGFLAVALAWTKERLEVTSERLKVWSNSKLVADWPLADVDQVLANGRGLILSCGSEFVVVARNFPAAEIAYVAEAIKYSRKQR